MIRPDQPPLLDRRHAPSWRHQHRHTPTPEDRRLAGVITSYCFDHEPEAAELEVAAMDADQMIRVENVILEHLGHETDDPAATVVPWHAQTGPMLLALAARLADEFRVDEATGRAILAEWRG